MTTATAFRNSFRLIPARLVRHVWKIAVLVVALQGWGSRLPGPFPTLFVVVVVVATVAYVLDPFAAVFLRRLIVVEGKLVLRVGVVSPTARTSALSAVTSVQVDEPWNLRVFGLRSVTIVAQGVESSAFVMEGLTRDDADRLLAVADVPVRHMDPPADDVATPTSTHGHLVGPLEAHERVRRAAEHGGSAASAFRYVPTRRDLMATIASQGTVVLAAAAVIGLVNDAGSVLGLDLGNESSWDGVTIALSVAALLVVSGVVAALGVRGFAIDGTEQGSYRIAYGGVGRTSHTIVRDQVVALTLVTTPLDALLGTRRVILSTAKLRESPMGEIKFPSMRRAEAAGVVREITKAALPELDRRSSRLWGLVPVAAILTTALVVAAIPRPNPWVSAGAGLVVLAVVVALFQYVSGRVGVADDASYVVWSRWGLSQTTTVFSAGCARVVIMRRLPTLRGGSLTLVAYAHRRHVLRKPVRSADALIAVRRLQSSTHSRPWVTTNEGLT